MGRAPPCGGSKDSRKTTLGVNRGQQRDREGTARLKCPDTVGLPSPQQQIPAAERQIVRIGQRKAVAYVEIGQSPVGARVVAVLGKVGIAVAGEEAGGIVDRLRPRVTDKRGEAGREAPGETRL